MTTLLESMWRSTRHQCLTLTLLSVTLTFCGCRPSATSQPEPTPMLDTAIRVKLPQELLNTLTPSSAVNQTDGPFRFEELGPDSGFAFIRNDDMHGQRRILEVNGGGAAILDFDLDGWLDVFLTNGCVLPLRNDKRQTPGQLFRNMGSMKFRECSTPSALMQFGFACGCATADTNEDGFEDLYVTSIRGNQFWVNNGDGTFSEVAELNGTRGGLWGSSAAFADLNGDRCLDLYVANYLDVSDEDPRLCPEPQSPDGFVACTPAMFTGVPDSLFLSDGNGSWLDASSSIIRDEFYGKGLGVLVAHLNDDRVPEVFVANDGQPNFLLTVEPDPFNAIAGTVPAVRLKNVGVAANVALNDEGYAQANMGIAGEDFDRDGRRDLFITHFFRETNTLYRNLTISETLLFEDTTRISRLGLPSLNHLGFGVSGADIDNNGWNDLLIANGHLEDRTWFDKEQPYRMTTQLFENQQDGTFRDVTKAGGDYFQKPTLGRGVAAGDLDRDGRVDFVISNQLDPSAILHNQTPPSGQSLILRLIGISSCRTPVGTRVTVIGVSPNLTQELVGGGSFQSGHANELHLGGLKDQPYDIKVLWPNGTTQVVPGLTPGTWTIREGKAAISLDAQSTGAI